MQLICKSLIFIGFTSFATAERQPASADEIPLKPLMEAMEKGGLVSVNDYLEEGGKWPCITTDSLATKNKVNDQKELVILSDRIVSLLRDQAGVDASAEIEVLESQAKLFFSLSEKFWRANGYRNRVVSLICSDLASHRCGKIVIVSGGEKMGPQRPEVLKVRNSNDMLNLFVAMIPEHDALANSGLNEVLIDKTLIGETWLEIIVALRKVQLGESTVAKKFDDAVSLRFNGLGTIVSKENVSALVFHYGSTQVMHESMLPALAMYLKKGGSSEMLLKEPTNATKFKEVMKNEIYGFTMTPVMSSKVGGDQLAGVIESIQSSKVLSKRLFGDQR